MKKLLLLILSVLSISVCMGSQKGFTTSFDISGMADTTQFVIRLHDSEKGFDDWRFDTIPVVNGHGVLADVSRVNHPVIAYAYTPYGIISFFVSNNINEKILGTVQDIENVSLTYEGAPWSEDFIIFNREYEAPMERLNQIVHKKWKTLSEAEKDSVHAVDKKLKQKLGKMYLKYPNSWVTLFKITSKLPSMPREDLEYIFANLTPDRKESWYGKTIENYLSINHITEGSPLADYEIEGIDQNGNRFRLSDMKEPYILVDFSMCHCSPCVMATKEIAQMKEKLAGKVGFVNYSCDATENLWRKAVERDSITWPSVFDGKGREGDICLKYNVDSYPTFFIFGPDRTLVKTWEGFGPGLIKAELMEVMKKSTD